MSLNYSFKALKTAKKYNDIETEAWADVNLSYVFLKIHKPDSALSYARTGYRLALESGNLEYMRDNAGALSEAYEYQGSYKMHTSIINYLRNTAIR